MNKSVLVVGNYPEDKQQSMNRYARLLVDFYRPYATVKLIYPVAVFGGYSFLPPFLRKYLSYLDKLILFPFWLFLISSSYSVVHIADHGNAYYSFCCSRSRCIVTCHDLLALRAALGDSTLACKTSIVGIWLQRLIIAGLRHADAVVFISRASFNDFKAYVQNNSNQEHVVIPHSLNANFSKQLTLSKISSRESALIPSSPFLLMVGSSHPRKNRLLALQLLVDLGPSSVYSVTFAGQPLSRDLVTFISIHGLTNRVHSIVEPSHDLLNHLYCKAHALLFPSICEGFGWPIIEAQACGCPVIASNTTSIPEVAGEAALYADPYDVVTFSRHVHSLEDRVIKTNLIHMGEENLKRFDRQVICNAYLSFAFPSI